MANLGFKLMEGTGLVYCGLSIATCSDLHYCFHACYVLFNKGLLSLLTGGRAIQLENILSIIWRLFLELDSIFFSGISQSC